MALTFGVYLILWMLSCDKKIELKKNNKLSSEEREMDKPGILVLKKSLAMYVSTYCVTDCEAWQNVMVSTEWKVVIR